MLARLLKRPVAVTMLLLSLIVLGCVSMRLLPVSLIPELAVPGITVQVDDASLSSGEMDALVLSPLRGRLQQIDGLESLHSESRDGSGRVLLTFSPGSDMDYLSIEVNEKVDRTLPELPYGISRPKVLRSSASDIPAFYIDLTLRDGATDCAESFARVSDFAESVIAKRIEQLDEVAMVDLSGILRQEILIEPDTDALAALGISSERFESLVRSADIRLGTLSIRDGEYRYNVKFVSYAESAEDIANIHFTVDGRLLRLGDIASVRLRPSDPDGLVRSGGNRAVTMAVIKQSSARMSELKNGIDALLAHFSEDYPELSFTLTRDQTALLDYSINSLLQNILLGVLLAVLVIFLFMRDLKSPLLVALTIPVSLLISMLAFRALGVGINIISLSGLILGVGMMVDNTIILVDNINSRRQRGGDLHDAVISGTTEVRGAMLSSVLTTCAVFLPLLFVSGTAGALFHDQALSIAVVLLCSWAVTVFVVPVYYYHWNKRETPSVGKRLLPRFDIDAAVERSDRRIMGFFLTHHGIAWVMFALSLAGCAFIFSRIQKDRLPPVSYSESILKIDWNEALSAADNASRVWELERLAGKNASQLTSYVGAQDFVLGSDNVQGPGEASVYMAFASEKQLNAAKAEISGYISRTYPSAEYGWEVSGNIFEAVFADTQAPLVAQLLPTSPALMNPVAVRDVLADISQALPGLQLPPVAVKTDVVYISDSELMTLYGVSFSRLLDALKSATGENILFEMVQGSHTVPVVLATGRPELKEILENVSVQSDSGAEIPVSRLLRQTMQENFKVITAGTEGRYYPVPMPVRSSEARSVMSKVGQAVRSSGGFEVSFSGSWFSTRRLTGEMALVFIIAVILLYLILASQFESLVQPLIILSEIVMDAFFCLLLLWTTGMGLNIMSLIGLVVVCGIVINDSILKIDTINRLRSEGAGLRDAVMEASRRRFKAILMTSLTTVLSVLPMLARGSMGADLQFPMSVVIVAGMIVGTAVSLFVVPAMYYSIYKRKS